MSTTLAIRVTSGGVPIAARVLLVAADGKPLQIGAIDLFGARQGAAACAFGPGVTGTWNGIVLATGTGDVPVGADACKPSPAIPFGRYHVIAWHGIDHERWEGDVDLGAGRGRVELAIPLERAWQAPGWLASDLHVHALGSNDSNMPLLQRVAAQAAAGIQVTALTNHNATGTLAGAIAELQVGTVITALPAIELTAEGVHVNAYPVPLGADPVAASVVHASPAQLFAIAHAFTGEPIVQVNHPRFRVTALFDDTGWNGVTWPPPFPRGFDAFEVINGFTAFNVEGDRRIDDGVRDLYTFTDHGWLVAAMGNSDTHDYNWVHDGTARTFVRVPDARVEPFDQPAFVAGIRGRHTLATTGPWLDVAVPARARAPAAGPGDLAIADAGHIAVRITVSRARFVVVDRVRVTIGTPAGPSVVRTLGMAASERTHTWELLLPVGEVDTWLGVEADGDTPLPLDQTGTYQRDKWHHAGDTPAAVISPILIDADADGRWARPGGEPPP